MQTDEDEVPLANWRLVRSRSLPSGSVVRWRSGQVVGVTTPVPVGEPSGRGLKERIGASSIPCPRILRKDRTWFWVWVWKMDGGMRASDWVYERMLDAEDDLIRAGWEIK